MNAFVQAAQQRKTKKVISRNIDPDLLRITDDPPPQKRVMGEPKYDPIFNRLKPNQRIACEPDEAQPIAAALRKFLKDKSKDEKFDVRSVKNYPKDKRGGVWMVERSTSRSKK